MRKAKKINKISILKKKKYTKYNISLKKKLKYIIRS